jgi:hypothetical protein
MLVANTNLNTPNKTTTIIGSNLQANAVNTNNGQININSQNLNILSSQDTNNSKSKLYFYDKRVVSPFSLFFHFSHCRIENKAKDCYFKAGLLRNNDFILPNPKKTPRR